jgi:class 3 adenylate cyclase/tetratricopeptide (TPR) repeat protein
MAWKRCRTPLQPSAFVRIGGVVSQPVGPEAQDGLQATLDRLGLGEFYDQLSANRVGASQIGELTEADLRELGLTLEQRRRFLRARMAPIGLAPGVQHGAAEMGERRQLTSLFCDLVASTPLAFRLDPEDLRDVIQGFQDICAGVITRGSGYVTQYLGDGVLAHFGYPRAREDDAQSAARAALEIVAKVGQMRAPDGEPLSARVGIATGLVAVFGEFTDSAPSLEQSIVGDTLNLAARLQAVAGPGQIIISKATRRLCGAMFEYEEKGDIVLKGFPTPLTIYRLLSEGSAESRFDARTISDLNPFVGREQELNALFSRWSAARVGSGQIVHVSGEPGIGKSRLALALIERLRGESLSIVKWNCAAHLSNRALHPIVRDIETRAGISRSRPAEARRVAIETLVAASPTLSHTDAEFFHDLLGIETETHPELDAASRARHTYGLLTRWLAGIAHQAPVLILVEDAHWADAATLDFLAVFAERIARLPVLLLITHRPEFTPPWTDAKHAETLVLDALDGAAGAQLLAAVVRGRGLPPFMAKMILEKASGVPLFVEELARTVLDAVPDFRHTPDSLNGLTIPATLQDSLMARLDQLGRAKELAQIGSVIGREFTAAMVLAVAPDHPDIEGALRRLCDSGLAQEYRENSAVAIIFHHALIQDAAYESLLKTRRRDLHRAVAEAMLADEPAFAGAEPEVIARHCSKGGLPEPAVSHWLAAGQHALARAANAPAVTYLRSGLEQLVLLPARSDHARTELQIHMALAPATSAIYGWAAREVETACRRAIELATAVGDGEALCGATWGLWTNYYIRGEMEPALETARAVEAMAAQTGSAFLALAAAHALTYTHYSRGEYREALAAGEAGMARFDRESDLQALRAFQLSPSLALPTLLANVYWFLGDETQAYATLSRAHSMAEAMKHPPALVHCLCVSSYFLVFSRKWERLRPIVDRAIQISVGEGFSFWEQMERIVQAFLEAERGDRDGAIRRAIENIRGFKATGASIVMSQFEPQLGELLIESGDEAQAVQRLSATIVDAERRVERTYLPELYRVRAIARGKLGDRETAIEDARTALAIAAAQSATPLIRGAEATLRALLGSARPMLSNGSAERFWPEGAKHE